MIEKMNAVRWREGVLLLSLWCIGCGADNGGEAVVRSERAVPDGLAIQGVGRPQASSDDWPRIAVLGDSLTAGLGLDIEEAFPTVLEQALLRDGYELTVINAGVSGDTTAAGLRRVEWALDGGVRLLIVALGGNDGLRGLPVDQMRQNLSDIVTLAQRRSIAVLLTGMEAPPNFGLAYTSAFRQVFQDLAQQLDVPLLPFLLEGVAGDPSLNQADGIHPNAEGAAMVAEHVREALEPLLPVVVSSAAVP